MIQGIKIDSTLEKYPMNMQKNAFVFLYHIFLITQIWISLIKSIPIALLVLLIMLKYIFWISTPIYALFLIAMFVHKVNFLTRYIYAIFTAVVLSFVLICTIMHETITICLALSASSSFRIYHPIYLYIMYVVLYCNTVCCNLFYGWLSWKRLLRVFWQSPTFRS